MSSRISFSRALKSVRAEGAVCFLTSKLRATTKITHGPRRRNCASWHSRYSAIANQAGERNALCDEFLDLCSIHGESDPGEPRLARTFLARIERGEVGASVENDPW